MLAMVGVSMLFKPIDVEIIPKLSEQRWNIDAFYAGSRQSSCDEDEVNEDLETAIQVSNNPLTGMVTKSILLLTLLFSETRTPLSLVTGYFDFREVDINNLNLALLLKTQRNNDEGGLV